MSSSRVTSRIVRSERRKMTRQIFWLGGISIVLILVFLFVVLPLFIRFVNSVLDTNPIAEENQEILLQAPVLASPVTATNSAQLRVSGMTAAEITVYFVVNSQQQTETTTDESGQFDTTISLSEGNNTIILFGQDADGNETRDSREYSVFLDTEAPDLTIDAPEEGQEVDGKDAVEIRGSTDPEARVYIDGRVVFPTSDGSFSYSYQFGDGEHTISIQSVDPAGNQTQVERSFRVAS